MRLQYELRVVGGQVLASGIEALRSPATIPFVLTAAAPGLRSPERSIRCAFTPRQEKAGHCAAFGLWGELTGTRIEATRSCPQPPLLTGLVCDARFPASRAVQARSGDLRISAMHGLVARSVQQEVRFSPAGYLLLDTTRTFINLGRHSTPAFFASLQTARRWIKKSDARITDEEDTLVSRQAITTDTYGVARLDWTIPANAAQGNYTIKVGSANTDEDDNGSYVRKSVHIYRYDLPNFPRQGPA